MNLLLVEEWARAKVMGDELQIWDNWIKTLGNLNLDFYPRNIRDSLLEHLTQKHTGYKYFNSNFHNSSTEELISSLGLI